ncbi:MAG: hypothetical protein H6832_13290 [Planctomycetes bacterium]|nr:hypothetical protein [Planctomycetota bacterium]MCB9919371.1 hypothetical protein [Planctomycetota bacterium]
MNDSAKNRRSKLVIMRALQSRIVLTTTIFPLIGLTLLTITSTVFCLQSMSEAAEAEVVLPSLRPLIGSIICLTAAFAITISYVSLRFSQRIAGPCYRIIEALKSVQEGNLQDRVALRDGDFLEEIADELNRTLDVIASGGIAECNGTTSGHCTKAGNATPEEDSPVEVESLAK